MKVEWSTDATNDLNEIAEHVARHNPRAAVALDAQLSDAAANLVHFPLIGRAGRLEGTREILAHPLTASSTPLCGTRYGSKR